MEKYDAVLLQGIAHLPIRRDLQRIDGDFRVRLESRHRTAIDANLAREIQLLHSDQCTAGPDHASRRQLVDGHRRLRIDIG